MNNTILNQQEETILNKIVREWFENRSFTDKRIFGIDIVNFRSLPVKEKVNFLINHQLL